MGPVRCVSGTSREFFVAPNALASSNQIEYFRIVQCHYEETMILQLQYHPNNSVIAEVDHYRLRAAA